jgi:periplasmic protein CpxP/Spy
MKRTTRTMAILSMVSAVMLACGISGTWANEPGYGKDGHAGGGHGSYGRGMMHSGTGHLIRHLLKHEKDLALTAEQVAKLKEIQLSLDKTRIKAEADIQIAERELKALTDEDKSDLGAVEAKLRQSEDLQVALRMTSIKTRREVMGLLTAEQRAKEKSEHDKVMPQHGKGQGSPHGGMNPHGANPHGKNPHGGADATMPAAPGGTYGY